MTDRFRRSSRSMSSVPGPIYEWKASADTRDPCRDVQEHNRDQFLKAFDQGLAVLGYERESEGNGKSSARPLGRAWSYASRMSPSMKIEAITLREIHMPLVHFFETSFRPSLHRRILLVTVHSEGIDGWERVCWREDPFYSSEWIDSAWPTLTQLSDTRADRATDRVAGVNVRVSLARVRSHRMAKAALENAVWDAEANQKELPLWKLLGGTRREIPCGVSIGIQDSVEQLTRQDSDRTCRGLSPHQDQGQARLGCERAGAKSAGRWADITLSCRRQLRLHTRSNSSTCASSTSSTCS